MIRRSWIDKARDAESRLRLPGGHCKPETRARSISWVLVAGLLIIAPQVDAGIAFEPLPTGGKITGITFGGEVAVVARSRTQLQVNYAEGLTIHGVLRESSNTGSVTVNARRQIPQDIVWILADVTTGEEVIVRPELPQMAAGGEALRSSGNVPARWSAGTLLIDLPVAEVLVVRKGHSAWFVRVADGGPADEDGRADGRARVTPSRLSNLDKKVAKQLDKLRKGDVVIVIDPVSLQTWSTRELGD